MAVRRKPKPQAAKPEAPPSADPFASEEKEDQGIILKLAKLMQDIFSHKGMFWLGVSVAVVCFLGNLWFYYSLFGELTEYAIWQCAGLALLVSCSTTLFELMPVIMTQGRRNRLRQILHAGAKPRDLPELNPKVVGDAEDLMKAYRNSDKETKEFFEMGRWIAIFLEAIVGFIFMGSLGSGFGALISLGLFIASIFGCEWGVSLALRAAEWELPPAIRQQLDELLANAGKALNLKRI